MIALVGAGAIALTVGGYAVGSTRPGDSSGLSAECESAKQEFRTRTAQIRKQILAPLDEDEDGSQPYTMIATRVKIVGAVVDQHPHCFGPGTRATVAVLRQDPSEGETDVVTCDLTGIRSEDCSVAAE
jgi:predicted amidohydrolase